MAKYTFEIESKKMYPGPTERSISELWDLNFSCEFDDDGESDNDFDIQLRSDSYRQKAELTYGDVEQVLANDKGTAVAGTRTNDTVFTRSAGVWTANALKGTRIWAENTAVSGSGAWYTVSSNSTTTVTIASGTLPAACNQVAIQEKMKLRQSVQVVVMPGFYGSFFSYKCTKKVPLNGNFKLFGAEGHVIPTNLEPEFIVKAGDPEPGWE